MSVELLHSSRPFWASVALSKPRIRLVRGGPSAGLWSCGSADGLGSYGFGETPAEAFSDWRRWQR